MVKREQYIFLIHKFLAEYGAEYSITRIGIFGSVARGEHSTESDIDVLVETPVLSLLSLIGIKHKLGEIFDTQVDVIRKTEYMLV